MSLFINWTSKWDVGNLSPNQMKAFNVHATNVWEKEADNSNDGKGKYSLVHGCYSVTGKNYNHPRFDLTSGELVFTYWPADKATDHTNPDSKQHVMVGYGAKDRDLFTSESVREGSWPRRIRDDVTFRSGFKIKIGAGYHELGIPNGKKSIFWQMHGDGPDSSFFYLYFAPDKWSAVYEAINDENSNNNDVESNHLFEPPEVDRWYDFEIQVTPESLLVLMDSKVFAQRRGAWRSKANGVLCKTVSAGLYASWAKADDVPGGGGDKKKGTLPQTVFIKDLYLDVENT